MQHGSISEVKLNKDRDRSGLLGAAQHEREVEARQLQLKQNGGRHHPPTGSPQEAAAGGLLATLTAERAALARTAPQTRRGSLLNAADISPSPTQET